MLTLEGAQVGLTFGRIAASGAVALKVLSLAQKCPSVFGTCSIQFIVSSNKSKLFASTLVHVGVIHEEDLSSFDRDGCVGGHLDSVAEGVIDVGDAVVRHEGAGRGENTCPTHLHRI